MPAAIALCATLTPTPLTGQFRALSAPSSRGDEQALQVRVTDLALVSGNAAIGAVSAAVISALRGGSFWSSFRDGAVGGAIAYAGRRVAGERFAGAGLIGREVGAVGSSMVRNASDGRRALEELVLPAGIAYVHVRTRSSNGADRVRVKFDVPTIAASVYFALQPNTRLDAAASLSSGTLLFKREVGGIDGWTAYQAAGTIWARGDPRDATPDADIDPVFAHERVHVLQSDFALLAWSEPIEEWLTTRLAGGSWMHRHLHLGFHLPLWGLANAFIPYARRPWEHEAHFLGRH